MINGLYVIKDEKVGFLQVQQDTNDLTAKRNFNFAMTQPDTLYYNNRKDFSLWKVGTFDTVTGEVILEDSLSLVLRAEDLFNEI